MKPCWEKFEDVLCVSCGQEYTVTYTTLFNMQNEFDKIVTKTLSLINPSLTSNTAIKSLSTLISGFLAGVFGAVVNTPGIKKIIFLSVFVNRNDICLLYCH